MRRAPCGSGWTRRILRSDFDRPERSAMLGRLMTGLAGSLALAGAYVVHEGAIRIRVDEQDAKGTHVHLLVPAALVPAAMMFVPEATLREAATRARPWLPAVQAATEGLAPQPDCDLLEVRSANEHVHVAKRGTLLVVEVESLRETVHVSVPLRTINGVAHKIGRAHV